MNSSSFPGFERITNLVRNKSGEGARIPKRVRLMLECYIPYSVTRQL